MEIDRQENGALIVRAHKGVPFYEAKWRDATRRQRKRRLGRAWLVPDADGGWRKRLGRVRDGFLDERRAYREMNQVIAAVEAEQQIAPRKRDARFEDAVALWMEHLEFEKRAKPSTLDRHRYLLAKPRRDREHQRGARIMREFEGRKLRSITVEDIRRFLSRLDHEDVSARTVNIHRQILHSVFEHARRRDTFGLRYNPVADTGKRPEEGARPVETFEPEEIRAVAEAARSGLHRGRGGYKHSKFTSETDREWARINEQDAALFLVAAFTGLRLGELLALHWSDVDLDRRILSVCRRGVEHQVTASAISPSGGPSGVRAVAAGNAPPLHEPQRLRLLPPRRRTARPLRRAQPLHPRPEEGRSPHPSLPRPTPQLRQPRDPAIRPSRR
jgi:integrase